MARPLPWNVQAEPLSLPPRLTCCLATQHWLDLRLSLTMSSWMPTPRPSFNLQGSVVLQDPLVCSGPHLDPPSHPEQARPFREALGHLLQEPHQEEIPYKGKSLIKGNPLERGIPCKSHARACGELAARTAASREPACAARRSSAGCPGTGDRALMPSLAAAPDWQASKG